MTRCTRREFRCLNCGRMVPVEAWLSGVHNRNHCPYCLWSRCLDLYQPGDRLSPCRQAMRPVGLSLKRPRKKYHSTWGGELLLVHQCQGCGKLSINRLAADDLAEVAFDVFRASVKLLPVLEAPARASGVELLPPTQAELVSARLFGRN